MDAFLKSKGGSGLPKAPVSAPPSSKFIPWVEKYRPKTVDDVAHQEEVVSVLRKCLKGGDIPNLLFYGPPGTGKTSTILALTKQLFGSEFKNRVLELNASDERGINVVREKIKTFAQISVAAKIIEGKSIPEIKMVILDEADSMTRDAQSALRRTMEKYTKNTRFCLVCNYVSRIIVPITSRCAKFRFKPLDTEVLDERIQYICKEENIKCEEKVPQVLRDLSVGDLRKAITYLQSAAKLKQDEEVLCEDIHNIAGVVPSSIVEHIITLSKSGNYDRLQKGVEDIMYDAYSATQIIDQLHDYVMDDIELKDKQKAAILEQIAATDLCLLDGADEYLQIMSLCSVLMKQYNV